MQIVLLSGGSGKRLWPLSNEANSKQFLRLLKNDEGAPESMVQRVCRQIREVVPKAQLLVSTNFSQKDAVQRQLGGKIDICVEPSRGNTFPAMVLAAAYLKFEKKLDDSAPFVVLPIDVCADIEYFYALKEMEEKLLNSDNNIVLLGVTPTYPSEKYGYILTQSETVSGFKEKPNVEIAEKLIAQGALWNCGVFALRVGYILEIAKKFINFENYADVLDGFSKLPVNSFDYQVVEHEPQIGVVKYSGKWKDLGTWNTLCEEISEFSKGENTIIAEGSENTHVLNMLDKPVIVLGISNAVVVASHDGILVSDKAQSSLMKPYAEKFELRAMYEQRTWGNYRVLDYIREENGSSLTKRLRVEAGKSISYQYHNQRSEIWVIISGEGIVTIDGVKQVVETGSVVKIPQGTRHKLSAATDIEFIEVQLGSGELVENDIVRE
ncbi:MAG: cupin domain-containing protein [Oscillospiraceae bacterium]|jgi:mannose-1-phosphate guanylyltransferase|nr:cupin domain-containing protein [Oscillospiraceae bacterium]